MRMTTALMIAAALAVSGPALAQDANNSAEAAAPAADNAAAANVADANAMTAVPANDMTATPVAEPPPADTYADTTPPKPKSGFPWGVLGLLGLLGLIPRRGRS